MSITTLEQTFKSPLFDNKQVRVFGTYEEPAFVMKDIAGILGLENYRNVHRGLEDYMKPTVQMLDSCNLRADSQLINEAGLYYTVMKSTKPLAKKFQKWIFTEVPLVFVIPFFVFQCLL